MSTGSSVDPKPEMMTQTVQITALRFTPAMVVAIIVAVGGGMGAYFSLKAEIGSKADAVAVMALQVQVSKNTLVLEKLDARQILISCALTPHSWECPLQALPKER